MRRFTLLPVLALLLFIVSCAAPSPPIITQRGEVTAKPANPEISMQHEFYADRDSLYLFLRFDDLQQVLDLNAITQQLEYSVKAGRMEDDAVLLQDSVVYARQSSTIAGGGVHINIKIPAHLVSQPNTVQMRLWQKSSDGVRVGSFFMLPLEPKMLEKDYLLRSASSGGPLFRNYMTQSEKLIVAKAGEADSIAINLLDASFPPAAPPMAIRQEVAPKTIQVVDTFYYKHGDTLSFSQKGLYLVEPSKSASKSLLVLPGNYPQVTMAQELIYPLVYITTSEEREALYKAQDAKTAVDNFWLKVGGNMQEARNLIREYYSRVETANKLYTSHKEGWATDRGMIYIIYGKPSRKTSTAGSEIWTYRESPTQPYVKFVFNKKENTFTENHYELVRNPNYEENWYSTVAKWRAGITDM